MEKDGDHDVVLEKDGDRDVVLEKDGDHDVVLEKDGDRDINDLWSQLKEIGEFELGHSDKIPQRKVTKL